MPAILETHDLVKKYGEFTAVKRISFHIQEGEIFSLPGTNGAGKTTTINMLSTGRFRRAVGVRSSIFRDRGFTLPARVRLAKG